MHIIVRNGFYTICWNIFFGFSLSRFIYRKESWSIQTLWCQLWRRPCSPFGLYTFCSAVWVHNLWKLLPSIWATQGILEILQKLVWPTSFLNWNAMISVWKLIFLVTIAVFDGPHCWSFVPSIWGQFCEFYFFISQYLCYVHWGSDQLSNTSIQTDHTENACD